jgi:hypothetical protein
MRPDLPGRRRIRQLRPEGPRIVAADLFHREVTNLEDARRFARLRPQDPEDRVFRNELGDNQWRSLRRLI